MEIQKECKPFLIWSIFTEKTIIVKPLHAKFNNDEKQEVLTWRITLIRQVKSYIDDNLNSEKVNVIDPIKSDFNQPLTSKIPSKLKTSKNHY